MRPHLQHHNIDVLIGDLPLVALILLDLIGQDEAVHDQGRNDIADIDEWKNVKKYLQDQRERHRQQGGEEAKEHLSGKVRSASYRACQIERQDCDQRQQQKRVERPAVILVIHRVMGENAKEQGA